MVQEFLGQQYASPDKFLEHFAQLAATAQNTGIDPKQIKLIVDRAASFGLNPEDLQNVYWREKGNKRLAGLSGSGLENALASEVSFLQMFGKISQSILAGALGYAVAVLRGLDFPEYSDISSLLAFRDLFEERDRKRFMDVSSEFSLRLLDKLRYWSRYGASEIKREELEFALDTLEGNSSINKYETIIRKAALDSIVDLQPNVALPILNRYDLVPDIAYNSLIHGLTAPFEHLMFGGIEKETDRKGGIQELVAELDRQHNIPQQFAFITQGAFNLWYQKAFPENDPIHDLLRERIGNPETAKPAAQKTLEDILLSKIKATWFSEGYLSTENLIRYVELHKSLFDKFENQELLERIDARVNADAKSILESRYNLALLMKGDHNKIDVTPFKAAAKAIPEQRDSILAKETDDYSNRGSYSWSSKLDDLSAIKERLKFLEIKFGRDLGYTLQDEAAAIGRKIAANPDQPDRFALQYLYYVASAHQNLYKTAPQIDAATLSNLRHAIGVELGRINNTVRKAGMEGKSASSRRHSAETLSQILFGHVISQVNPRNKSRYPDNRDYPARQHHPDYPSPGGSYGKEGRPYTHPEPPQKQTGEFKADRVILYLGGKRIDGTDKSAIEAVVLKLEDRVKSAKLVTSNVPGHGEMHGISVSIEDYKALIQDPAVSTAVQIAELLGIQGGMNLDRSKLTISTVGNSTYVQQPRPGTWPLHVLNYLADMFFPEPPAERKFSPMGRFLNDPRYLRR